MSTSYDEKPWNSKHVVNVTRLLQECRAEEQTKMVAIAMMQRATAGELFAVWLDYEDLLANAKLLVVPFTELREAILDREVLARFDVPPPDGHVRLFHTVSGRANWADVAVADWWPEVAQIDWARPQTN